MELYRDYWDKVSDEALALERSFTSHRLIGGHQSHVFRRFVTAADGGPTRAAQAEQPYNPAFLTEAGSVFVLRIKTPDVARHKVSRWLQHGLDLPDWAETAYGKTFETNPYLPANGYGEIRVNLPVHRDLRPTRRARARSRGPSDKPGPASDPEGNDPGPMGSSARRRRKPAMSASAARSAVV